MRCSLSRRGFTLVELLVVIAIIGILARISHRALKRIAFWGHKLLATTNFLVSQKAVR